MFTLLLVDDFFVERENVKDIIIESGLDIELIGECSNGLEALEFLYKEQPDFILTDIEMPFMNGLELAEEVKERYPDIKLIFISFYEKFEYARKAIDVEAYAYILKPIIKDDMIDCLNRIIEDKKQEIIKQKNYEEIKKMLKESRPLLMEKLKRDMFLGLHKTEAEVWERIEYFDLPVQKGTYLVIVTEIDDYDKIVGCKSYEQQEIFAMQISKIIDRQLEQIENGLWAKIDDRHWAILISHNQINVHNQIEEMGYSIAGNISDIMFKRNISISIGVSPTFNNIAHLHENYKLAVHILQFKFNLGKGQIIRYEDVQEPLNNPSIDLNKLQKDLNILLTSGDEREAQKYVEKLFIQLGKRVSQMGVQNLCFAIIVCAQISLNELNITLEEVFGTQELIWKKLLRFSTILDIKQWLINILSFIVKYVAKRSQSESKCLINEVMCFIEENYYKKISVQSIAEHFNYNGNYLNNLFKQETGVTLLEYITKVRIETAKKLLVEEPDMKIYEICETVGYQHETYFRNLFKRYTGFSPKEYRNINNG